MGAFAASRAMFDPVRAHGAWVYLFASVGAGALVGAGRGVEPALLVGTGFAGAFLCSAALASGVHRKRRQLLVGVATAVLPPLAALGLGADRAFLWVAACAVLPAAGAVYFAARLGYLSPAAMVSGIAALALAAPAGALAGGASPERAVALFLLLGTFFSWRSLRIAAGLRGAGHWDRDELRARGLREAAIAAVWALIVSIGLQLA